MGVNIVVPELGESVVDATVLRWLKQEGEPVRADEPVVELETDKVNLEVRAPRGGTLARIGHKEGEDVKIGDVLGVVEEVAAQAPVATPAPSEPVKSDGATTAKEEIRATPIAERMASEYHIDLHAVPTSAADGRITRQDVEKYLEQQKVPTVSPQPAPVEKKETAPIQRETAATSSMETTRRADREERVKLSRRRQTIARRLVEGLHTAAMLTTFNEIDMSAVVELRQQRKESFKQRYGVGLGITVFFVKAAIGALKAFPMLNAEIQNDEMVLKHYYDIGVAVAASEGLVVPVLRDADRMSFAEIEKAIDEMARKAETGTLSLEDLRGGTFTITNGGIFGSMMSTPILNPPQVAILGLHKIEERPLARDGQVVIRPVMYVALSYDHRLVDGREAVQFLVRVKELIEDPTALLLEG
ncbi:MAG TPA: 2-oxoglutarate dehydrogenase complex dihydrolipoyllysine-residue succinyltransferase [Anaerolineae bacterium]|nr:2-oxoglutarate dehydrogenase complex dihydrolipoyllysine-residue succinyltransferase [Anaerolineae bacterium]